MKYLSLDIETTGLDKRNCQVISVGAIADDFVSPIENLPRFECLIQHREYVFDSPFVVAMHSEIFRELARRKVHIDEEIDGRGIPIVNETGFWGHFDGWLNLFFGGEKITAAGKQVGSFDIPFLAETWPSIDDRFRHRVLDYGPLYYDHRIHGDRIPDTKLCCKIAGIEYDDKKAHTALYDAELAVQLVRHRYKQILS